MWQCDHLTWAETLKPFTFKAILSSLWKTATKVGYRLGPKNIEKKKKPVFELRM